MRAGFWQDDWRDRRDLEGRWLLEQGAADYQDCERALCPYSDSRQGAPMNAAALEQVQRYWSEICGWVRQATPPGATLQQAFQAALELVCRPLLSEQSRVGAAEAATYKACVGFCQVFCWLVLADEGAGHQKLADFGEGRDFFQWLEREGWLRGTRQVCAGSQQQIIGLFRLFCSGQGPDPGLTPVVEAVALQAALLLTTPGRAESRAPWVYAITARPQAQPDWARRLLPARSDVLETFLRSPEEGVALELLAAL